MQNKKTNKVLSPKNLPTRLPFSFTVIWFLLMERFNAPQWLWGALGFFIVLLWGISLYLIINQKKVDLFENDNFKNL